MMRAEILGLYKQLIRYSGSLRFTDKNYFVRRVKKEFLKNKSLTDASEIDFQYQKGQAILKYKRVI